MDEKWINLDFKLLVKQIRNLVIKIINKILFINNFIFWIRTSKISLHTAFCLDFKIVTLVLIISLSIKLIKRFRPQFRFHEDFKKELCEKPYHKETSPKFLVFSWFCKKVLDRFGDKKICNFLIENCLFSTILINKLSVRWRLTIKSISTIKQAREV